MAQRKRKQRRKRTQFIDVLKKNENGGVNITQKTIEEKQIHSLFNSFTGTFTNEKQVLQSIVAECKENGIQYTLSAYCKDLLKQGAAV